MPRLFIASPAAEPPNVEDFDEASGTLTVSGVAFGRGMPEPVSIATVEVTSSYGAGAVPPLEPLPGREPYMSEVSFICTIPLPEVGGIQTIVITATDEFRQRARVERLVENFAYGPH